jgi:ribonuclease P protein component
MRAYQSLRRRADFARLSRRGKRRVAEHLVLLAAEGRGETRVGITVTKAIGGAVVRNRLRRRIKAILDRWPLGRPPYRDLLFIARPGAGEAPFEALAGEVGRLLERSATAAEAR